MRCKWVPRYHLNLFNDQDVADEEGIDLPDLASAKLRAIAGGRSVMAEHLLLGRPLNLAHRIEIADASGKVLATVPFRELVTIINV